MLKNWVIYWMFMVVVQIIGWVIEEDGLCKDNKTGNKF